MTSALDQLTGKQRDFVLNYVKCGVVKHAALDAGYAMSSIKATIHHLSNNPKVQAAIRELRADDDDASIATIRELRQWWTTLIRGERDAEMKERLKASELLGKSQGAFLDRVDITNSDGSLAPTIDVSKLSTETLRELLKASRAAEQC